MASDPREDAWVERFYVDPLGPYVCDRTIPEEPKDPYRNNQQSFFLSSRHADQMCEVLNFLEGAKTGGHSPGSLRVLEALVRETREEHHKREPLVYAATQEEEEAQDD